MSALLDPVILFFVLGLLAGMVGSKLDVPSAIVRFLSIYLLMAIGLKGGIALAEAGFSQPVLVTLVGAVLLAFAIPLLAHQIIKRLTDPYNAAALAATYGSVSAVTFITANQFLSYAGVSFGGHMTVALVVMETPAVIMGLWLATRARHQLGHTEASAAHAHTPLGMLRECLTDGGQVILLGSLAIGFVVGPSGAEPLLPLISWLFKGLLAIFLLDMGWQVAQHLPNARKQSPWLLLYAVAAPLLHALLAIGFAWATDMQIGDATLLAVLAASASYIVVPAVVRDAIPEASPAVFLGMSLGVTFPFNILIGIPLYYGMASAVLG